MKLILPSSIFFLTFFLFFPGQTVSWLPSIQEDWVWNKSMDLGLDKPNWRTSPFQELNGYIHDNKLFHFETNQSRTLEEGDWRNLPYFGDGSVLYKKIGDEVSFQNPEGEILWTKPYNSYPRSSPSGKLLIWISGDQNKVFFTDTNGNPIGVESVEGRYLTDLRFSEDSNLVLVFSGGEVYFLNERADLLWKKNLEISGKLTFFKSVCISPQGEDQKIGVHLGNEDKDEFWFLDSKGEILNKHKMDFFIPLTISLACQKDGSFLIPRETSIQLYSSKGQILLELPRKSSTLSPYFAVVAFSQGWILELDSGLEFLDLKGNSIRKKFLGNDAKPWRLLPDAKGQSVYLETQKELWRFSLFQ